MILILSDKHDVHADTLENKLLSKKLPYFRFNLDVDSLKKTHITNQGAEWNISHNKTQISSSQIQCVWARTNFVKLLLEEEENQTTDFRIWKNEWNRVLLGFYLSISDIPWINPLRKAYQAENKFLQLKLAHKIGFNIPPTITSNDKNELLNFTKKHEEVALKIMEQNFYRNTNGQLEGLYVNKININEVNTFQNINENPVVLQKYIKKKFEVRYTVIGSTHLVCKIDSQKSNLTKTDWRRYNIPQTPHLSITPPDEIKKKVDNLMEHLELSYGALDFIVGENNEWYFLEINSMGQYLWIEDLTGLPITDTIVEWLNQYCLT